MRVASEFLLKLGNNKSCHSDFYVESKPNNKACQSDYRQINCLGHNEETCILVSVALSIYVYMKQKL